MIVNNKDTIINIEAANEDNKNEANKNEDN